MITLFDRIKLKEPIPCGRGVASYFDSLKYAISADPSGTVCIMDLKTGDKTFTDVTNASYWKIRIENDGSDTNEPIYKPKARKPNAQN